MTFPFRVLLGTSTSFLEMITLKHTDNIYTYSPMYLFHGNFVMGSSHQFLESVGVDDFAFKL